MINKFFIILLALSSCFSMNAQLNKIERKIVSNIDANTNLAIDLLKEVVNINSGSLNLEGVKLVGENLHNSIENLDLM
jgi:glutamate carboxypeptidase